jgi:hypothetical protein
LAGRITPSHFLIEAASSETPTMSGSTGETLRCVRISQVSDRPLRRAATRAPGWPDYQAIQINLAARLDSLDALLDALGAKPGADAVHLSLHDHEKAHPDCRHPHSRRKLPASTGKDGAKRLPELEMAALLPGHDLFSGCEYYSLWNQRE